ncbi:GIN domain-containing protein [Hymenobacter humi]|uniref:GIN domain-containing protein n=1 Tax=Hymenobacter humi TaxID=1411620 RepID=A0ABW2U6E9_9BACT
MVFTLGGAGRLYAQNLNARRCYFNLTRDSDGDAHVRASQAVGGTVGGTGTLYYSGNPVYTDIKLTGKGQAKAE